LNEIPGLETPTLENICVWVADKLRDRLPNLKRVSVARPSLGEMCTIEVG
jgi:6-pyruvoyltetrahydropterin/6-carboxytetrahydropterin synthase